MVPMSGNSVSVIRPFLLSDAPLITQLQTHGTHLDLRLALLWPHSSLSAAMSAYLPFQQRIVRTLVLKEHMNSANAAGYVQYRERSSFPEADILFCAPALESQSDEHTRRIWQKLISQLVVRVGEHGVQRVYARVLDGALELDLFWQMGFSAYARERTYRRSDPPRYSDALPAPVWRPQRSPDLFAVGQLYSQVTPKLVQQAENLPQMNALAPYRDSFGGGIDRRYVWKVKDDVRAALRLIRGHHACWFKLMMHPHELDHADELVQDAMRLVPPRTERIFISVREYQSELEGAFLRAGFSWLATEMLMVKHTTALVREAMLKQIPVIEGIEARPTASSTRLMKKRYAIRNHR